MERFYSFPAYNTRNIFPLFLVHPLGLSLRVQRRSKTLIHIFLSVQWNTVYLKNVKRLSHTSKIYRCWFLKFSLRAIVSIVFFLNKKPIGPTPPLNSADNLFNIYVRLGDMGSITCMRNDQKKVYVAKLLPHPIKLLENDRQQDNNSFFSAKLNLKAV